MTRSRDPFRDASDAELAAEALEDAIDKISEEWNVFFTVENDCCGCAGSLIAENDAGKAYVDLEGDSE